MGFFSTAAAILSLAAIPMVSTQQGHSCPALMISEDGYNVSTLPSPFLYLGSTTGGAVNNISWDCRRSQISFLAQYYELGALPGHPDNLTASLSSNTLTIDMTKGNNTASFTASITYPSGANSTQKVPAIIALGGPSIPVPSNIAVISFDNSAIAQQNDQSSRGVGKFYDLWGNSTSGAMIAWTWAISRIIDSLEMLPDNGGIDLSKLGVTGCSRNGKGALVAGAFEQRIALTIPQESGSGGDACWRLSLAEQADGFVVQTSPEIVQENVWFGPAFDPYAVDIGTLPLDHHMLAALVAPRALFAIENTYYDWLSPRSSYGCMKAAHTVWEAMGVPDHMGFSQDGNHSHCMFPADQQDDLNAFIGKFLLDQDTDTNIFKAPADEVSWFNATYWMPWTVPTFF